MWDAKGLSGRTATGSGGVTKGSRDKRLKRRVNATKILWSTGKVSGGILDGIEKKKIALFWEQMSRERCDCDNNVPLGNV